MSDGVFDLPKGREDWAWLDTKDWMWLTNAQADDLTQIMRIEEAYGQENVRVDTRAFDYQRNALGPTYVAIFVNPEAYEAMILTGTKVIPD